MSIEKAKFEFRQKRITAIAKQALGFENFEAKNMDSADFRDIHISTLEKMLQDAFEAGANASKGIDH